MANHTGNAGCHTIITLAFLIIGLQVCQGWDGCLEGPWLDTGTADSNLVNVSLSTFDELQQHIDAATGPTAFVIESLTSSLVANRPVQISKADVTISSSSGLLSNDGASDDAMHLSVGCASAGSLLQIRAPGFKLLGFHISGCSSSAVQLVGAKRAILRKCTFSSNTNNAGSIGGGAVAAIKSQMWVDSCSFSQNSVAGGPGGALSTVTSQVFITNSQFSNNKAADAGGAVALQGRTDAALTASAPACWKDIDSILDTVQLQQNQAALQGGALATNGSHVMVHSSIASSNTAKYGGVVHAGQAALVAIRSGSSMMGNTGTSSGGVVYAIGRGVRVILQSSSFAGNTAEVLGGVLSAKEAAGIRLDGSIFSNNTAKLAAGVVYARDADMIASTCRFANNTATRDGGALYCAGNCNWTVKNSQFDGNKCGANGGAFFGWNLVASISSSSLQRNAAGALGGAVSAANSTLDMSSCMVGSNSAIGADAAGGGVYSQSSILKLTDSTFSSNTATWGGAVYVTNGTLALAGGSITNSSVSGSGAGVYVLRTPTSLVDVKFEYNDAEKYAGSLYCHASSCSLSSCSVNYDSASLGAGSIWVGYGSVAIKSTHIHGCVAKAEGGGGMQALGGASLSMVASSFTGCSALKDRGGGMDLSNVASALIRGSLFSANRAMVGGSISVSNSSITIGGSGLFNSTATAGGCLAAVSNSTVVLYNGTAISGNAAAVGGGLAVDNTTLSVTGPVAVWQNKALQPSAAATATAATAVKQTATFGTQQVLRGIAGGIYAQDSRIVATRLKLERNTADRVGGGGYYERCGVRLINSSVSRNTATEEAGGLKMLNPATGSALNGCILAANWAGVKAGGLSLAAVDLVSDVALVDVQLMNNTAAGESAGGLHVSGPLGLLMVGGELSGNAAGAAAAMAGAAAEYSSFTGLSADGFGNADSSTSTSARLEAAGGGMLLEGCSWAALQGVDVWGNAAPAGCGGGIAVSACGKFKMDHTTVEGNVAASGGGACIVDISGYLTICNSSVSSNRALLGGVWGGLGSSLAPTPEPHLSCRVPGTGGGLCIDSLGQVLINGTRVSKNQARNGGAMALGVCQDGTVCSLGLFGATFTNNTAVQGGGGAVYFTTTVAPDQVMCGEDYNTSAAIGYVAGTTYPALETLLQSATFNVTPVALPTNKSVTAAAATSSSSAGEGVTASTAGSAPGSASSSSTAGAVPSSSGDDSSDDYTVTPSYDPTAAATPSAGTAATTVTSSGASASQPAATMASTSEPISSMRVTSKAKAVPPTAIASAAAATAHGKTGTGVPSSSPAMATAATVGTDAIASAAGSQPTAVSAVSFDPGSGASTTHFQPESAQVNTSEWDADVVATPGFNPTAMTTDTQEFGTASAADPAATAANQQQAANGSSWAAFQARSAAVAATTLNASGTAAQNGTMVPESGAQIIPNDMGQIAVRNAKEALQVLKPPIERTYTFPVGNGLTASTTEFVDAAAKAQAANKVLQDAVQDGNSSTTATQGMQPIPNQASTASTGPTAGSLLVPVTLEILAKADQIGVSRSLTASWREKGVVSLQDLLTSGVVSQSMLDQFWSSGTGPVSAAQLPKRDSSNAHSYDMYLALAVALTQAQAAAALHTKSQQLSNGTTGSWDWGSSLAKFNPYTTTCDPVQNPAACPVPNTPSTPESGALNADTRTALAAAAAAALAASGTVAVGGNVAVSGDSAAVLNSITPGGRRRLLEIDEAVAEQEAAAAVEAAVAAGGQPSEAPTTGLILQGTSQCGTFENNTAMGAKSYGPVVTSRPAGLRVFDGSGDPTGPAAVTIATGGLVQVQIHVVDVFGGVVTSGAADYIRVRATLQNPNPGSALSGTSSAAAAALAAAPGLATAQAVAEVSDGDKEVDSKGVTLSGLQQLSTSNGSLVLSGVRLSGQPGTNSTLWFKASDPSLLPASVTISLTTCSAGYMQLPGSCQLCLPGTYSFSPDEPRCAACPLGATCNGTVLVPQSGYWHSGPRSSQVHVCWNPAACARDSIKRQQIADWQTKNYGLGLIVGKSKAEASKALEWYMTEQCAAGYAGTLCANCAQNPAAVAANRVSHGRIAGACIDCGERKTVLGMYILARAYDLVLWAALTWLAWRAAKAWAKALTLNPATAAATSGSLPSTSTAAAGSSSRVLSGEKGANSIVLVTSEAAAAAAAGVGTSAALQAHVWVFLDYLQMLSIISCSAVSYAWPKLLQAFMIGFTFVPLGTSKWVSVECLLPYHLTYRRSIVGLLLTAALPLFYLGAATGLWIASLMMGKTHRTPILAVVVGTCLFYPLVTMSALSTFSCQYLDTPAVSPGESVTAPGSYWTLDPDLKCYESQHLQVMLGFGVPVVLLVVLAWPLLLASMLWDSRFRIREQQQHPATRRRYLVRKTIKLCHELLGVMSGFYRPRMYLWPVLVEVRKLVLCVVVVLASGSTPAAQLYVLWGVLAVLLLLEWWAKPASTWPLVGLQLVALGALQADVYLASAFTQVTLQGAASTFTGLIISVSLLVALALLLSLVAGLRGRGWFRKVLDAGNDGKVSGTELVQSAGKLLHLNIAPNTGVSSSSSGGASSPRKRNISTQQQTAGSSSSVKLVSDSPSRLASWRLVFAGSKGKAVPDGEVSAAAAADNDGISSALDQQRQRSRDDAAVPNGQDQRAGAHSPQRPPVSAAGHRLAAGSLPIVDAGHNSISAAAAAAAAAAVNISASIDMGALHKLTASRAGSSLLQQQLMQAVSPSGSTSALPVLPPASFVTVDMGQYSGNAQQQRHQQQQQGGPPGKSSMARAKSAQAAVPGGMPLQTYMSVHQWLTESEELSQQTGPAHSSGWPSAAGSGAAAAPLRSSRHSTRSLQEYGSSAGPYLATSSGSMALQRQQMLQQLQESQGQQRHVAFQGEDVDVDNMMSVSQDEEHQQKLYNQQRHPSTGHAAAARLSEVQGTIATAVRSTSGVSTRHQPYYALWSNVATALADPAASSGSRSSPNSSAKPSATASASAQSSGNTAVSTAAVAAAVAAAAATGVVRSAVKQSPFAAPAAVATAFAADPAALIAAAAAAGAAGVAVRSVSMPAGRPAAQHPFAAAAAIAAAAATGKAAAAAAGPAARNAAYYNMWQQAGAQLSGEVASANTPSGGAAGSSSMATTSTPTAAAATNTATATSGCAPVSAQRSATAPPGRHNAYIGLWQTLAGEMQEGPSAVGANAAPPVAVEVAAAIAAQQLHHQQQEARAPVAAGRRTSPFAALAAATAAMGDDGEGTVAGDSNSSVGQQQQQQRRRQRSGRLSRRGRRSSAAGAAAAVINDDDTGSDASAYCGSPLD